jgi:hypothetical protein
VLVLEVEALGVEAEELVLEVEVGELFTLAELAPESVSEK